MSSPQRNPKLIDLDFTPPDRRSPQPVPPGTEETPTAEIRALMNQLQQTAYEARHRLSAVEDERDSLAERLAHLEAQNEDLRSHHGGTHSVAATMDALQKENHQLRAQVDEHSSHEHHARIALQDAQTRLATAERKYQDVLRQREELNRSLEALRRSYTEVNERYQGTQTQISNLRQARDSAQSQNRELSLKIAAKDDELEDLRDQLERLEEERHQQHGMGEADAANENEALQAARREIETLKTEVERLRAQSHHESVTSASEAALAEMKMALEAALQEREEAEATASEAVAELARMAIERDEAFEQVRNAGAAATGEEEVTRLQARLEAQRLETIELATRYQEAQDEIRKLSATVAEVRLQARMGVRPEPGTKPLPTQPEPSVAATVESPASGSPTPTAATVAAPIVPTGPFATAQVQEAVRGMRRCFQAFVKSPADLSHLNELHCVIHGVAEDAKERGFMAVHRLGVAFANLVQELYEIPEQLSPAVLSTVSQTIEFFQTLLKVRDLHTLPDPAEATVYVVDDDSATCECVLMAVESASMQAKGFTDPVDALRQLSTTECDLIAMDIQMPGMDGFELCAELRQRPQHKDTPILFVTGQCGQEMRSRASMSGGSDFVMKPFLLCEMGLKCLLWFAKSKLRLA